MDHGAAWLGSIYAKKSSKIATISHKLVKFVNFGFGTDRRSMTANIRIHKTFFECPL